MPVSPTAAPERHAAARAVLHEARKRRARARGVFLALSVALVVAALLAMSLWKC